MMATIVIGVVAVFFLGMGCYALAAPAAMLKPFGTALGTAASRSEVRAVYGGFGLAIAAMLAVAAAQDSLRAGIVLTVGAALAGMAGGRLISAVIDSRTPFYPNWFYCVVEAAGAAALFAVA